MVRTLLLSTAFAIVYAGCGDPIERQVRDVLSGGEGREQAMMELLLRRGDVVEVILPILNDTTQPAAGRIDLVDVLWKINLREGDVRILVALTKLIGDPSSDVRASAAQALGDMEKKKLVHPLLARLVVEEVPKVQLEILRALEVLDGWKIQLVGQRAHFRVDGGAQLTPDQRIQFTHRVKHLYQTTEHDSVRLQADEFLEKIVAQIAQDADKLVLKADLSGAEARYREALEVKPNSKNVLMRLGKFYLDNLDRPRGLELLMANGLAIRAPHLEPTPAIDGELDEPVWRQAARIDSFYEMRGSMRAVLSPGRTETYVGYTDTSLLVAFKGYEETTANLVAEGARRDDRNIPRDDSVLIFMHTDRDVHVYSHLYVNSVGAMVDWLVGVNKGPSIDTAWNMDPTVASQVNPTHWTTEVEIPFRSLNDVKVKKGDIWGFSVGRQRMIYESELSLWTPTYGLTRRPDQYGILLFD